MSAVLKKVECYRSVDIKLRWRQPYILLFPTIIMYKILIKLTIVAIAVACLTTSALAQLFSYTLVDQQVNDIAYSQATGMIYAAVPSTGGIYGNYIIAVEPRSGQIIGSAFAGSEPTKLATTADGTFLYVGFSGASLVKRFQLPSLTTDLTIDLGSGSNGAYFAEDIAPIPGRPNLVAISRRNQCCSPRHEGVVLYNGATIAPNSTPRTSLNNEIEASADGSTIYAYNNETSGFEIRTLAVDDNGVSITSSYSGGFGAYSIEIRTLRGLVYGSNGKVLDPSTGSSVGVFSVGAISAEGFVIDRLNRRIFFGTGSTIKAFDLGTYQPMGAITLPTATDTKAHLVRWGRRGLAYRNNAGQLVIAETLLVTAKRYN